MRSSSLLQYWRPNFIPLSPSSSVARHNFFHPPACVCSVVLATWRKCAPLFSLLGVGVLCFAPSLSSLVSSARRRACAPRRLLVAPPWWASSPTFLFINLRMKGKVFDKYHKAEAQRTSLLPRVGNQGSEIEEEIAKVVEEDFTDQPELCTRFMRLSTVLRLYNLKAAHGWTYKSFTVLFELLKGMLSEDIVLPQCTYQARKTLCTLGLDYEKIQACRNDYINPNLSCGELRYKRDKVPSKVVWYFPIILRFKHLFADVEEVNGSYLST
ncbi:hypothetical protein V2J09_006336 [Rumex salicifolius]